MEEHNGLDYNVTHVRRYDRTLSLYRKGLITTPEFSNKVLADMIEICGSHDDIRQLLASVPEQVQQRIMDLLNEIRRAGYNWSPFTLGPGGSVLHTAAEDSAKLREVCIALGVV